MKNLLEYFLILIVMNIGYSISYFFSELVNQTQNKLIFEDYLPFFSISTIGTIIIIIIMSQFKTYTKNELIFLIIFLNTVIIIATNLFFNIYLEKKYNWRNLFLASHFLIVYFFIFLLYIQK